MPTIFVFITKETFSYALPAIVLKYLDDDILHTSNIKRLARIEVKYVARRVLEALSVLHQEGFVHTGKLLVTNIFN